MIKREDAMVEKIILITENCRPAPHTPGAKRMVRTASESPWQLVRGREVSLAPHISTLTLILYVPACSRVPKSSDELTLSYQ